MDDLTIEALASGEPDPCVVVDWFWETEMSMGYEVALKLTADKFGMACAEVERLTIEGDALNNGNF